MKWYAPESISCGVFSHASDVWSYGVTLWEMYSYGQQPYGDMSGAEVTELVAQGSRLSQPSRCPDDVYALMIRCWVTEADQRPSFSDLVEHFGLNPEYDNVKELLQTSSLDLKEGRGLAVSLNTLLV